MLATGVVIQITWAGDLTSRQTTEVETECRTMIDLDQDGVVGGSYNGRRRASDSCVLQQYRPAAQIANVCQFSIVSQENIAHTGLAMGIAELSLEWWGANLVVTVCNYFPYILPASRLQAHNVQRLL